jgi:hypothetical protein
MRGAMSQLQTEPTAQAQAQWASLFFFLTWRSVALFKGGCQVCRGMWHVGLQHQKPTRAYRKVKRRAGGEGNIRPQCRASSVQIANCQSTLALTPRACMQVNARFVSSYNPRLLRSSINTNHTTAICALRFRLRLSPLFFMPPVVYSVCYGALCMLHAPCGM